MAEKLTNCFLVNAPAGSGKTTQIKAMVQHAISKNPKDNILCITYTNRAADELVKDINTKNVFIGTIHSFLHNFMKRYFCHSDILDLFFEIYGDQIIERIENHAGKDNIEESNNRYIEKYGELNFEAVKRNIEAVSYNESPYNSLYYGGLSHDDLISFSKCVFDRYPVIQKRISLKYQIIFIDEYQDTMADVLRIFYDSIVDTNCQLYLFGDRMQQIYKNYDGSFEEQFKHFDTTKALTTNYRSVSEIVSLLNKIYNDSTFVQENSPKTEHIKANYQPRIIVSDNVSESVEELKKSDPTTLVLYLLNKDRFSDIGALNLFEALKNMDKYSYGKTYSAANVLTMLYEENPDPLLKLLYCVVYMSNCYQKKQYGLIIQTLKANKPIFRRESWCINKHSDKQKLHSSLREIFANFEIKTKSINDLLLSLKNTSLVNEAYMEGVMTDEDYKAVFSVPSIELRRIYEYLAAPKVSTQHGVKGESHDSVVFVAEDSSNEPIVHMYRFFEMWGQLSISVKDFNQFYYAYISELSDLQDTIKMKINALKKDTYSQFESVILDKSKSIFHKFNGNPYFDFLCKDKYTQYLSHPVLAKAKECLKGNEVWGVLSAYKLFYVGCSRARKNLTILLNRSKITGDFELQKNKFTQLGFQIL